MIIADLNFLEPVFKSNTIKGGENKDIGVPRQSFADAQAFSFVDDSPPGKYDTEEIQVSASTFTLVELGRSKSSANSFGWFKGR